MTEPHPRTFRRDAVVANVSGLPSCGVVYTEPFYALAAETELPCLVVLWENEPRDEEGTHGDTARVPVLAIGCYEGDIATLTDKLDVMSWEVERALEQDRELGGLTEGTRLIETAWNFDSEGDRPVGSIVLRYEVPYLTHDLDTNVRVVAPGLYRLDLPFSNGGAETLDRWLGPYRPVALTFPPDWQAGQVGFLVGDGDAELRPLYGLGGLEVLLAAQPGRRYALDPQLFHGVGRVALTSSVAQSPSLSAGLIVRLI